MMMGGGLGGWEYWPHDVAASLSTPQSTPTHHQQKGGRGRRRSRSRSRSRSRRKGEEEEEAHERPERDTFIHENQLYADSWPPLTRPTPLIDPFAGPLH